MGDQKLQQVSSAKVWELVKKQHGVVTRKQLLAHGLSPTAIRHRIVKGRLHPLWRGVYAVGRPEVSQRGRWTAAVLCCGPQALLSHRSAGTLWGLWRRGRQDVRRVPTIEVVIPHGALRRHPGIHVHRRTDLRAAHRREVAGIPVTDPVSTLVDLASCISQGPLERAINEADRLDLVDPEALRAELMQLPPRPGMAVLRRLLGGGALTDTGLERRFSAIARRAGLPKPETQVWLNGYRVDFYWPSLRLIVETDGWRYHRTPGAQTTDYRRDQAHTTSGLTTLRFAEEQIRKEPHEVWKTLVATANRLAQGAPSSAHPSSQYFGV